MLGSATGAADQLRSVILGFEDQRHRFLVFLRVGEIHLK